MSVAEQIRQKGGHALLILDDLGCMVHLRAPVTCLLQMQPADCIIMQAEVWAVCWQALSGMLPSGHGEEQVQFADMMVTANEAERRRWAV